MGLECSEISIISFGECRDDCFAEQINGPFPPLSVLRNSKLKFTLARPANPTHFGESHFTQNILGMGVC